MDVSEKYQQFTPWQHRNIIFYFFAIILLHCPLQVSAQPSWVTQTPVCPDHYIGIGSASKTPGSSEHIARARDMALEQIASGIAVTITGEASQHIIDQSGMVRETFESNISSMVKTDLKDYELADSWENDNQYWVYYRLSKTKYRLNHERQKKVVASRAFDMLIQGEQALNKEEVALALTFYLQAAKETGPYRGTGLPSPANSDFQYIDVEAFSRLSGLLSAIRLNVAPQVIQASLYRAPSEIITVKAAYYSPGGNSIAINKLPVRVQVIRGDCIFNSPLPTDSLGSTTLSIARINAPVDLQIKISPDIATLGGFTESTIKNPIFAQLNIPYALASAAVRPVRVLIIAKEENMQAIQDRSVVAGRIKQHLTARGWSIVNEAANADCIIYLNATTAAGTQHQDIHTAFASGNVSLTDNFTREEIFRANVGQVNAGGPNYKAAGEKALERLAEKIIKELETRGEPFNR
ncbi:MAG: LPP20 family lipoprotein [Bacteroidota bacterium]